VVENHTYDEYTAQLRTSQDKLLWRLRCFLSHSVSTFLIVLCSSNPCNLEIMSVWHSIVTAWFALVTALCLVSARPPVNLANMRIPKEMRKEVLNSEQVRSVERFVEATKNTGFFSHTDKTFAPYLAEHSRFFALFYAPFSESCNEFLEGYKTAAESLVEEGYAANFTVGITER